MVLSSSSHPGLMAPRADRTITQWMHPPLAEAKRFLPSRISILAAGVSGGRSYSFVTHEASFLLGFPSGGAWCGSRWKQTWHTSPDGSTGIGAAEASRAAAAP